MDFDKQYGTNKKAEVEGKWLDQGDGQRFKVARVGNEAYRACLADLMKPHQHYVRTGRTLPESLAEPILIKGYARTILRDWEGVVLDGKPLPYSEEAAIKLLTDYPDFFADIQRLANSMKFFQDEEEAAVTKNS